MQKSNFKIKATANGTFIVMEEVPVQKPWFKFWGPNTIWKSKIRKDGKPWEYENETRAKAAIRAVGGRL
jgi:hypothetical protein